MASVRLSDAPAHRLASRRAAAIRHAKREGIPSHLLVHAEQALRDVAASLKTTRVTQPAATVVNDRLSTAPPRTQHLPGLLAVLAGGPPEPCGSEVRHEDHETMLLRHCSPTVADGDDAHATSPPASGYSHGATSLTGRAAAAAEARAVAVRYRDSSTVARRQLHRGVCGRGVTCRRCPSDACGGVACSRV